MKMDLGFVLGVMLDCILMIYYANTTFYPKKDYLKISVVSVIGYAILLAMGMAESRILFITIFFIVNFILFAANYHIGYKNAAFQSMMLNILSSIGEYIILFIWGIRGRTFDMPVWQMVVFTIESKTIYLIGILIMKRLSKNQRDINESSALMNIAVPMVTMIIVILMWNESVKRDFVVTVYVLLLVINIIVFAANEIIILRSREMQALMNEQKKHDMELDGYKMLFEKYEKTKVMRHDFKEQIGILQSLISDNNEKARKYANNMKTFARELDFAEYSDNKVLNILLNQKVKECCGKGINLYIKSTGPELEFLSEIDTVAIFSNLINNAIEGCIKSQEKNIFIDLDTKNGSFSVIKVENNSDEEPQIFNETLITSKKDADSHGIGMKSIQDSVKNYGGQMDWSYDKNKRFFRTVIIFNTV